MSTMIRPSRMRLLMAQQSDAGTLAEIIVTKMHASGNPVFRNEDESHEAFSNEIYDTIEDSFYAGNTEKYHMMKVVEVKEDGSPGEVIAAARLGFPREVSKHEALARQRGTLDAVYPILSLDSETYWPSVKYGIPRIWSKKQRWFAENIAGLKCYHIEYLIVHTHYSKVGEFFFRKVLELADAAGVSTYTSLAPGTVLDAIIRKFDFEVVGDGGKVQWLRRQPKLATEGKASALGSLKRKRVCG